MRGNKCERASLALIAIRCTVLLVQVYCTILVQEPGTKERSPSSSVRPKVPHDRQPGDARALVITPVAVPRFGHGICAARGRGIRAGGRAGRGPAVSWVHRQSADAAA